MFARSLIFLCSLFLSLTATPVQAAVPSAPSQGITSSSAQSRVRSYGLSDGGAFQIIVPVDWKEQIQRTSDTQFNIIYRPGSGAHFEFMITPISVQQAEALAMATVQKAVQDSADKIKDQAIEQNIPLVYFHGAATQGYYFNATDKKALAIGEFKNMTQGIMTVGSVLVPFTILNNDSSGSLREAGLNILRSAAYKKR